MREQQKINPRNSGNMLIWVLIVMFGTSYMEECECNSIDSFAITDDKIPTKGGSIEMICTSEDVGHSNFHIYKTIPDLFVDKRMCFCWLNCTSYFTGSCTIELENKRVVVSIPVLERDDQGTWFCTKRKDDKTLNITLTVYTLPSTISFENVFTETQSLATRSISITCKTDQCTYNIPAFTWYYTETDGSQLEFSPPSAAVEKSSVSGCSDSEMIYTSNLTLPLYTTAPNNDDLSTKFQCKLSFERIVYSVSTNFTSSVLFAVKVTNVTLTQGNKHPVTGQKLIVTMGVPNTLTCTPGLSRPSPTIDWYIGTNLTKSSESPTYQLTAVADDHGKDVYCKAYNLQNANEGVLSEKPTLVVKIKVTTVTLTQGNNQPTTGQELIVTAGIPNTLTCTPGLSRPSPTIDWYIETKLTKSSTSTTYQLTAVADDHGKEVYCKAYNIQNATEGIYSEKPNLYVQLNVTTVTLTQGNKYPLTGQDLIVTAGIPNTLTCTPGLSRPSPTIDWYIGTILTKSSSSTTYQLTAVAEDHGKEVFCKAYNLQSANKGVLSEKPTLFVKIKVTQVTLKQANNELGPNVTVTAGVPDILSCIPGLSRPAPTIDWYIGNSLKMSSKLTTYELVAIAEDHGEALSCKAYNLQDKENAAVSSSPKLYVKVNAETPMIVNGTLTGITLLDGDTSLLQCKSTPTRPAANMIWMIGNVNVPDTESEQASHTSGLVTVMSTVKFNASRALHEHTITCQSKITGQKNASTTASILNILWPPHLPTVTTVNRPFPWVEGQRGELNCSTLDPGNPSSDVIWPGYMNMETQKYLTIEPLNYKDNGRAIRCQMKNDYTFRKDVIVESDEIKLDVQFSPKVFPSASIFIGEVNGNLTISIPFLVNPTNTSVKLMVNGTTIYNPSKYITETFNSMSESLWTETSQTGHLMNFTVFDLQEADFKRTYVILFENSIGRTNVSVTITSESRPLIPTKFKLLHRTENSLIVYWEQGYNGGHAQMFFIQITESEKNDWQNKTIVAEFDSNSYLNNGSYIANITILEPGTYNIRLIAANIKGQADAVALRSSVKVEYPDRTGGAFPLGAAVGGGVGSAALIILAAIILVIWKRKSTPTLQKDESKKQILTPKRPAKTRDIEDTPEINLNPVYESAGPPPSASSDSVVYSQVDKNGKRAKSTAEIYSQVNKPNKRSNGGMFEVTNNVYAHAQKPTRKGKDAGIAKQKKQKPDKKTKKGRKTEGDFYENVDTVNSTVTKGDTVYENPSCSIEDEHHRQMKIKDGLIYADLDLPKDPVGKERKAVIHGLDDKTDYADIKFGEVGEQVPESDEENTNKDS